MSNSSLVNVKVPAYSGNYTKGRSGRRISMIAIHHMAGVLTAKQCGRIFQQVGRNGSSNYGIGKDGEVGLYVDEANTSWCNSNWDSNCKSVTIETSNSSVGGKYPVSDKVLNKLIQLVADIAKRNGLGKLVKGKNLVWHSMYVKTNCPGPYLFGKLDYIIEQANKINGYGGKTPSNAGIITYQAYVGQWLPEVSKADNTDNGWAGIGKTEISGFRCKPANGELIYEAHLKGGNWLGAVSSKNYKKNDLRAINSYAGVYGHALDGIRIKSTKGSVAYRVKTAEDGWLPWASGFGNSGNSYAGIYGHTIVGIQIK